MNNTDTIFSILTQINFLCDKFKGKRLTVNTDDEITKLLTPIIEPMGMNYKEAHIYSTTYAELADAPLFMATCKVKSEKNLSIENITFEPILKGNNHLSVNDYLNRIRKEAIQEQINEHDAKVAKLTEELIQAKEQQRILLFKLQEIR